jgi:hypothetical protein
MVFVPGFAPELDACHIDGDKQNNRADNLRWGTRSENILDQVSMGRHRSARKTHCAQGHEFTAENTYRWRPDSQRVCRACRRARRAVKRTGELS